MKYAAIKTQRREQPVSWMCRQLGVSRTGYYDWLARKPSRRAVEDKRLRVVVKAAFRKNRGVYGSPRLVDELRDAGEHVGRRRVARLMREQRLCARLPRRFRKTTDSTHDRPCARNIVDRNFRPDAPNQVWASDITYIRTWQGWAYLAVVIDLHSRRVVGWAIADHMRTDLVLAALIMAIRMRKPPRGIVHHSDRGAQYASRDYRRVLARHGFICSMSRKGDCWDNAVVESFFGTLKTELVYRASLPTILSAAHDVGDYIRGFYNSRRRHSTLGNISPMAYERNHYARRLAA